jgi:uncharacterized protein YkwD
MPHKLLRRATALTLIATGLLAPSVSAGAAPEKGVARMAKAQVAQAECANADATPTADNGGVVRAAILCLHNQVRAERGLPALRENAKLRKAAVAHSADMVRRGFFEHTAPGGVSMVDRIFAARYASNNVGWALGENLAWGTGRLATPRLVMRAWMDSPGHRANVVKRAYRELGIGVVIGTPTAGDNGATYTADFGVIRK